MAFGTTVFAVIWVPPVAADVVNHPTKLYPALVGVGIVPINVPGTLDCVVGLTLPPFAFQVIVIGFTVHLA